MMPDFLVDYKIPGKAKSNRKLARCLTKLLPATQGQTTVEYMLFVAIIVVAMAGSLSVLFDALAYLFNGLGSLISKPYP
ncbi:MAG: hypothetical protein V1797_07860 [Pseudomonadota bacterium]